MIWKTPVNLGYPLNDKYDNIPQNLEFIMPGKELSNVKEG